jgi:hypothetical protein
MHECPACGMACDCDGDDLWNEEAECRCDCEDHEDFDACPICGSPDLCDCEDNPL